jgi:hypothetical protein
MTEQQPVLDEEPEEESGSLPPDYDAPGQVDYPDPAFEDEEDEDEADIETPDDGEPVEEEEDEADAETSDGGEPDVSDA